MRKRHLTSMCVIALATIFFTGAAARAEKPARIIDTHIHLYDTEREGGVPWPHKTTPWLYKPHLPADFKKTAQPLGVTDVVVVEASHLVEDNQWLLDLVKDDDYFVAIVGNLSPASDDFAANLKRFAKDPRYVGIRVRNNDVPFELNDKTLANLRLLAEDDMTLDLLTGHASLEKIDELAREIPDLRIVVNHCLGQPFRGQPADDKWKARVHTLAQNKNVYCKFSGLIEQSGKEPAPADVEYYRPVLDVLWKEFGPRRMVFASNWPVINKAGDYAAHLKLVRGYLEGKGDDATERVFWKNAAEVYRLDLPKRQQ